MSTVHVSLVQSKAYSLDSKPLDVAMSRTVGDGESITTSGTTVFETTLEATEALCRSESKSVWRVANMGSDNIYVAFGGTGDYSTQSELEAAGMGIPPGVVEYFAVTAFGEICFVSNA
jgi:hypothetical protein